MPSDLIHIKEGENAELVYEFEIEWEYVHHLKEFYKRIHWWLEQEDFVDVNGMDKYEQLYWQRDLPNGKVEHHLWWRAWKYPGYEIHRTKQFKWYIQMTARTIDTTREEVMYKGKKWKLYMGNPTFNFKGWLVWQFYEDMNQYSFFKPITKRFKEWVYKDQKKMFKDGLEDTMHDLQDICKAFLKLKQEKEIPHNIYPPSAQP